jgi:hypothetical protein
MIQSRMRLAHVPQGFSKVRRVRRAVLTCSLLAAGCLDFHQAVGDCRDQGRCGGDDAGFDAGFDAGRTCPFPVVELTDDFEGTALDDRWDPSNAPSSGVDGGRFQMRAPPLGWNELLSAAAWPFAGRSVIVHLVQAAAVPADPPPGHVQTYIQISEPGFNPEILEIEVHGMTAGATMYNGGWTTLGSAPYDPMRVRVLRLREDAGTVFFECAPSVGGPWSFIASRPTPGWVDAGVILRLGTFNATSASYSRLAVFDDVDLCP